MYVYDFVCTCIVHAFVCVCVYCIAGNFHGVLIFVTFVVDLAVMKFSHPRKLKPTVICKSMMMGVAKNIVAARHFPVLASNSSHCHSADGVFDTNILLSQAIYPSFCGYGLVLNKEDHERDRACVSSLVQSHTPGLVAILKFKTKKINSEGLLLLSTKISAPENYPPYSIRHCVYLV